MATITQRDLRGSRHGAEITNLRTAANPRNDRVHLISLQDGVPRQEALCGVPVTRHVPRRLIHEAACPDCVALALDLGATCVEDRHGVLVNLRRIRT
jgi:hypothetical protein